MRKISEVFINGVCLEKILEDHENWLNKNPLLFIINSKIIVNHFFDFTLYK